jgi:hypothetical protein
MFLQCTISLYMSTLRSPMSCMPSPCMPTLLTPPRCTVHMFYVKDQKSHTSCRYRTSFSLINNDMSIQTLELASWKKCIAACKVQLLRQVWPANCLATQSVFRRLTVTF